jgi:hypothetical protein
MRLIIFFTLLFLLITSVLFSQKKSAISIGYKTKISQLDVSKLKSDYANLLTIDSKIKFINNLGATLEHHNLYSDIDHLINGIIKDDFISKIEQLTDDQIEKLKLANFPIPKSKKTLNIFIRDKNIENLILFKSQVIYEEEDIRNDSIFYVGIGVAFVENNNLLVYHENHGHMANSDGIFDFAKKIKSYYFFSIAPGGTGSMYYQKFNEDKIVDKKQINYLDKINKKYELYLKDYWNLTDGY